MRCAHALHLECAVSSTTGMVSKETVCENAVPRCSLSGGLTARNNGLVVFTCRTFRVRFAEHDAQVALISPRRHARGTDTCGARFLARTRDDGAAGRHADRNSCWNGGAREQAGLGTAAALAVYGRGRRCRRLPHRRRRPEAVEGGCQLTAGRRAHALVNQSSGWRAAAADGGGSAEHAPILR